MVVEKTNTQTNNKVIPAGGWRSRRLFRVYKQSPRTRKKKKKQAASVVVGTKEFWRCWARPEPLSPSRKRRRIHHPSLSLLTCTHVYSRVFSSSSSTNMAAHRQGPKSEMMWISLNSILKDADVMAGPDWVVPITHKLRKRKKTNGGYRWAVSRLHSATTAAIRSHTKKKNSVKKKPVLFSQLHMVRPRWFLLQAALLPRLLGPNNWWGPSQPQKKKKIRIPVQVNQKTGNTDTQAQRKKKKRNVFFFCLVFNAELRASLFQLLLLGPVLFQLVVF